MADAGANSTGVPGVMPKLGAGVRHNGRGRKLKMGEFYNPYHFVPAQAENRSAQLTPEKLTSRDSGAVTHMNYAPGTRSGRLICKLHTESPIFIGAERTGEGPCNSSSFQLDNEP